MPWLCCSSICIFTELLSPKYFGVCGSCPSRCLCTGRDSCRGSWGVWLAIDGFAYVIMSLTSVLLPQYQDKVDTYSQPALFGEVTFMFWLLIKGAKPPTLDPTASSSAAA